MTSDRRNWLLRGFAHQWKKYGCGVPLIVAGFTKPEFELPDWITFHSIGKFEDYPASRWSNALIKLLGHDFSFSHVGILLEDYFLTRTMDVEALVMASHYMQDHPDILRFDLTTDRLNSKNFKNLESARRFDLIESLGDQYDLSLQASYWNVESLLKVARPDESPWQLELDGTGRLKDYQGMRVVGTRQNPISYLIAVRNGHFSFDGSWMYPPKQLTNSDIQELKDLHYDFL